ncbi:hypothetical protein PN36_21890 [Candidatus Thiomargarita nelsonii]|uniref:Uncharacterized protein n=1 Tax=Candidatus Thiomargarita nelsonii TaxID=1003181 RepID=A0A0A6PC32_9GAMM|nr:hypothetical protein PN36_21890 [Candidatus Thiomargarita nelsonii]
MTDNWREAVNQTINTAKIEDINQYVAPSSSLIGSPIDAFYATTQDILNVANPDWLHQHPSMGTLLLVGLISASENYLLKIMVGYEQVNAIKLRDIVGWVGATTRDCPYPPYKKSLT